MISTSVLKPHTVKKTIFFITLVLVFLTTVASIHSAPEAQSDSPTVNENLPHLALDHYEMNPRDYLEADPSAHPSSPAAPSSPDYLPWSRAVYQSYRTDNWDIYLSDDEGSYETRLTTSGDNEIHPRLNRGSTRVAYAVAQNGNYEIYIMNSDGTSKTRLTTNTTDDVNPYWSPDGSKIVFQAYRDGQPEIYVMNADGSGQNRLTNSGDYDGMPAWSPDGTLIAFSSRRTGGYRIYTMHVDGSNQVQRSNQPYSLEPAWSPDSSQIAYTGDNDNNTWFEVWLMNADGSSQDLKHNPGNEYDALTRSWSPDGQFIAFTLVHYIYYQGNWYWLDSRLQGVGVVTGYTYIGPNYVPYRDWYPDWQTLDTLKPTSRVNALSSVSPALIAVSWSGSDAGDSGVKNYDVQVRDGANGSWTAWKTATAQTSATYTGVGGHTYYFRSRSRDNSYNVEAWPATPDAATTVESSPPLMTMIMLPAYSPRQGFTVQWTGYDFGGSGIASYDVQYRPGTGGSWTNLVTNTTQTWAIFNGTAGTTYYFQVRGRDNAQNTSAWPGGNGHTFTALYTWAITGMATNNGGTPIMGMTTTTNPVAFASLPGNTIGQYGAYVATSASTYAVDWSKTGYGDLPLTLFDGDANALFNVVLPPSDSAIQNGHFEIGGWANWQTNGTLPVTQTQNVYHTGTSSALLGNPATFTNPTMLTTDAYHPLLGADANGVVHATWNSYNNSNRIYYSQRTNSGTWSTPLALSSATYPAQELEMTVMDNGQVHVFWIGFRAGAVRSLYYARRNSNGTWTTPLNISGTHDPLDASTFIDAAGRGHVIYIENATLYYVRQNSNDTWTTAEVITQNVTSALLMPVARDTNGNVHAFWTDYNNDLRYARRGINGTWSAPITANTPGSDGWLSSILTDAFGGVHLLLGESSGSQSTLYYQKIVGASWSEPEILSRANMKGAMVADEAGNVYVVWAEARRLYYAERTGEDWTTPQLVYASATQYPGFHWLTRSENGTLYLAWYDTDFTSSAEVYFSQRSRQGNWEPATLIAPIVGITETEASIAVDQHNVPHLLWFDLVGLHYASLEIATQAGSATLQQTVTIPISQTVPTLSFFYRLEGTTGAGGSGFTVQATQGSTNTTLLTAHTNTSGWQHMSIDMTAFAGQTITLTFGLDQIANQPMTSVYLDEVTLGSTQADVWVGGDDETALPGETVTYAITYGNQGAAAANAVSLNHTVATGLTFVSATVPPTQINGSTLTWALSDLNSGTGPVTIYVTVQVNAAATPFTTLSSPLSISTTSTELETSNNQAIVQIYLAQLTYLPIIIR